MALPLRTTGSLRPAFAPARPVSLAVKLPYAFILFARRPPQSNYPPNGVLNPDHGPKLESQHSKGGISPLPPPCPKAGLLRLPPILRIKPRNSALGCSKGARGLSVPQRVSGVFTRTTISLSLRPRQRGNRYTFHAGRNLPDKEFRYLRTVIVTAAVYRGFG